MWGGSFVTAVNDLGSQLMDSNLSSKKKSYSLRCRKNEYKRVKELEKYRENFKLVENKDKEAATLNMFCVLKY